MRCSVCGNRLEFCTCRLVDRAPRCRTCGNLRAFCHCPGNDTGQLNYPGALDATATEIPRRLPELPVAL